MNIRVPVEALDVYNVTSLRSADGCYVAQLGDYHELALSGSIKLFVRKAALRSSLLVLQKNLKQWMYCDYYFPNLSSAEFVEKQARCGKSRSTSFVP